MNIDFSEYFDNNELSDLVVESSDNVSKRLHKIVLSKNSITLKNLIDELQNQYNQKLILNFKWKYLEIIFRYMYTNNFSYNYPNVDNHKEIINDFIEILHICIHFKLQLNIINVIKDHFNYQERLHSISLENIRYFLYSLYNLYDCNNLSDNMDIIINLSNNIIINILMDIDTINTIKSNINDNELFSQNIYDNIICLWNLDSISSLTILEFIDYNIKYLIKNIIPIDVLYELVNNNLISKIQSYVPNNDVNNLLSEFKDTTICNNLIIENIISNCLNKPDITHIKLYRLVCKNNSEHIIDKLITQKEDIDNLGLDIQELNKKIFCKICYTQEVNMTIKSCGHTFCNTCLNKISKKDILKCPICKTNYSKYDLFDIYL